MRRAYARQMLAILGVDNRAIEAAFAAAPREAFLGPPPWTASSPFGGYRPLPGADPVVLYQDWSLRSIRRAASTTAARRCTPNCSRRSRRSRVSASSMSAPARAIIARSWPRASFPVAQTCASSVTTAPAGRKPRPTGFTSVSPWRGRPIAGSKAYVRAAVVFPLGVLGPGGRGGRYVRGSGSMVGEYGARSACLARQRPNSGGRHSDCGAALRIERRGDGYAARAVSTAYFVCAEGEFEADPEEVERLRAAFDAGGLDTVCSLIWKRPALSDRCWFAGKDWALSRDETP